MTFFLNPLTYYKTGTQIHKRTFVRHIEFNYKNTLTILFLASFFFMACGDKSTGPEETPPPKPEFSVAPQATNIQVSFADITWETNTPSTSLVKYGKTSGNLTNEELQEEEMTIHSIRLLGLTSNTTYYFTVESSNSSGTITSTEMQLTTTMTLDQMVPYSWEKFESGDYEEAIVLFLDIASRLSSAYLLEAYKALGYAYATTTIDSLEKSLE